VVELASQPPLAGLLLLLDVDVVLDSTPGVMKLVGAGIVDVPFGHDLLLSTRLLLKHFQHASGAVALVAGGKRLDRFLLVVEVGLGEGDDHWGFLDVSCLFGNLHAILGGDADGVLHLDEV